MPGPDFPTGGIILGRQGILDAYSTGRGRVRVRGKAHTEELGARARGDHRHRAALRGEEGRRQRPRQEDRRARPREEDQRDRRPRGPLVRARRHADRHHAQARRDPRGRAQPALQAHAAADDVRREHGRARRERAAHAEPARRHQALRPAPARGRRAPHEARAARARAPRPRARGPAHRARQPRRDHRAHPRLARPRDRARRSSSSASRSPRSRRRRSSTCACRSSPRSRPDAIKTEHADKVERIGELRAILGDESRVFAIIVEELREIADRFGDERRTRHRRLRGRDRHRGPHPRAADGHHDHEVRLHQVAAADDVPRAAARRARRDRDGHEGRRLHRAPLRVLVARLPAVLLQPRQGLPLEGLRAAGGVAHREGPRARQRPAAARGRADPVGALDARLHRGPVRHLRDAQAAS